MTEKLSKLLDLAADALSLYIRKTTAELGEALPLPETPDSVAAKDAELRTRVPRKPRATKAAEPIKEPETESPFGNLNPAPTATETAHASIEDQAEAKRRCQEVMGLFIRRYLKAQPTGLDRAKGILTQVCGRAIAKLEDLTHADNVKLIPVFEAELEKAA